MPCPLIFSLTDTAIVITQMTFAVIICVLINSTKKLYHKYVLNNDEIKSSFNDADSCFHALIDINDKYYDKSVFLFVMDDVDSFEESSNYFFGLTEMAIALLNNRLDVQYLSICHKRINKDTNLFQFYNPLNFVVDTRVRDVAEYFKHFDNKEIMNEIYNYIKNNNLSKEELILFFIRLIYPTYYYDLYEKIISGKVSEKEMNKIIKNIDGMEMIIKKTYMYLSNICSMPLIEWLIIK